MNTRHAFGIDMGTGSVKIYDRNKDTILEEINMIAVRDRDTVFAVGNDAYELFEKNPDDIQLITPMKNGRIQDVLMMEAILHTLLRKCSGYAGFIPVLFFSVPLDMTELERRAYSTIAKKGRFRRSKIFFVEKPIADAISIGIPLKKTDGTMVVNIGEENTEVSIIAEGRILISRQLDLGGQSFDSSIISGVIRRNGLTISQRTAQRLKFTLSDLTDEKKEGCKVGGIDKETGLPRDGIVSSYTVSSSVEEVLSRIAEEISRLLERIPPQIVTSIRNNGVFLTGGGTHVPGIDRYLRVKLDYPIRVSRHYERGTVIGLKRIIEHTELQRWATAPAKRTNSIR